jgi:hypothetical protein
MSTLKNMGHLLLLTCLRSFSDIRVIFSSKWPIWYGHFEACAPLLCLRPYLWPWLRDFGSFVFCFPFVTKHVCFLTISCCSSFGSLEGKQDRPRLPELHAWGQTVLCTKEKLIFTQHTQVASLAQKAAFEAGVGTHSCCIEGSAGAGDHNGFTGV